MPDSLISRFVFLESSSLTDTCLRLRFIPVSFDADYVNPIVHINVDLTADLETAAQKIALIEDEYIDDITVDESSLSIYPETLDTSVQFHGPVTWKREGYAISDYIVEIELGARIQSDQRKENHRLSRTIDRALRFIDRTIDRIEKKQAMMRVRDPDLAEQIQLLRGARRHLTDD